MQPKKVVFIEPSGSITNVFESFMNLPLLGTLYLGTILHNRGHQVTIINENILGRPVDPFEIKADVFCLSSLTVSANRVRLLASQIRRAFPQTKIIIGGIHPTLLPDDFTDVAHHVVLGEAEDIICDLVEGKFTQKVVQGNQIADVGSIPPVNYGLLKNRERMDIIPIMTSRGCPFNCIFCTVTRIFGKKFRNMSASRIIEEVKNALTYFKTNYIFFYDDNFTANKKRVYEFCDLLEQEGLKINWFVQARTDLARDEALLQRMSDTGCSRVYIGFESINDETLKAYHKSQTRADIVKSIQMFQKYGISIHGMFMFGEDNDNLQSVMQTVDFIKKYHIDTAQLMILTPFPGTVQYEEIERGGRLFHKNWDYFNGMYIVFQPKNMSALNLQNEVYRGYKKLYSWRRSTVDAFSLVFNILLDALVWNFKRTHRYALGILFFRALAKLIVSRYSRVTRTYLDYLTQVEKKKVLGNEKF